MDTRTSVQCRWLGLNLIKSKQSSIRAVHHPPITTSGMESVQSFTGCCVCTHCWSRMRVYDGYRRFLADGSRGRRRLVHYGGHVYEYTRECVRPKPKYRDTEFARLAVAFAKQRDSPYMGHKIPPMLSCWTGFDWRRYNIPDMMHG